MDEVVDVEVVELCREELDAGVPLEARPPGSINIFMEGKLDRRLAAFKPRELSDADGNPKLELVVADEDARDVGLFDCDAL